MFRKKHNLFFNHLGGWYLANSVSPYPSGWRGIGGVPGNWEKVKIAKYDPIDRYENRIQGYLPSGGHLRIQWKPWRNRILLIFGSVGFGLFGVSRPFKYPDIGKYQVVFSFSFLGNAHPHSLRREVIPRSRNARNIRKNIKTDKGGKGSILGLNP
jgi:hypothetical protein